jgi:prepilin signal peptidase PulO-like enzyme (type II secretory pathway)
MDYRPVLLFVSTICLGIASAVTRKSSFLPPPPPAERRMLYHILLPIGLSLMAIAMIFSGRLSPQEKHWAFATLGAVMGFALGTFRNSK